MNQVKHRKKTVRRAMSVRKNLFGTTDRPRLSVYRSNEHISAQLINDETGKVLLGSSDMSKESPIKGTKIERAKQVAQEIAKKMKKEKISKLVFDRGSYRYHGRVKALAEALRSEGIDF